MARILTTAFFASLALLVMGSVPMVAPHGGKAFAADMATKAPPVAPAPIGKGKAPVGKGKAPIVTKG
jgi:hypothetical protein